MANMSETGLCNPPSDCDAGEVTDEGKEDVTVLDTDLLSVERNLENRSGSTEDISTCTDDSDNYVMWTVYIALAFPREEDSDAPDALGKTNLDVSTVLGKVYKAQSCFHVQYKLLPGDLETFKVDIVVFGPVAKMYKEDEFKILRTWSEGDQTWVGWTQDFKIRVDRELLMSLLTHKITLQIWNGGGNMSGQARCERMKPFRPTQVQPEDATDTCGDIKTMVNKLRSLYESNTSGKNSGDTLFNSKSKMGSETEFRKPTIDGFNLEDVKRNGTVSAEISPISFLAGETSLTQRFPVFSSGVFEVMCNISLDRPLISDQLKAELNPLVITIKSATSMPSSPVPFHVLQEKCVPLYCQYKVGDLNMHRTNCHKHGNTIDFKDAHVILTGLMSPQELREFLSGPPLEIEVHDRDMKLEGTPKTAATFGTGSDGGDLFKQKTAVVNSHGVARLNFSELLLLRRKSLTAHLQIECCPSLDTERVRKTRRRPMPPGHYFKANSQLKVEVEISRPLRLNGDGCAGPFGRIVYLFGYNDFSLATELRSEILRINASAFHLDRRSPGNTERALSNYTMNFERAESRDLDFVTGFHVLDKTQHIFVLEGLRRGAVRRLWEAVPMKRSGSEQERVIVLYNSGLDFFRRIYDSLDVGLRPIHLKESLEAIMRQPRVYVRGSVRRPCFQALLRLSQLCQARQLKEVVQCDLFPSADMILGLRKNCGTHAEQWKPRTGANTEVDTPTAPDPPSGGTGLFVGVSQPLQPPRDFVQDNVNKPHRESERLQKPKAAASGLQRSAAGPVHDDGIRTFNSSERAKEQRGEAAAQAAGRRFTSSQRYHSATVEPGHGGKKQGSRSTTATPPVWFPRINESKVHPRHPDEARVEELRKPWRENILHGNTLKPTLPRDTWGWQRRHEDFQLHSNPPPPVTAYLAGDPLQQEQRCGQLKKQLPGGGTNPPGDAPLPRSKCPMGGEDTADSER
ncbi:uncharacterized protein FLJ43738 isoform X2 [Pseudoliparis swirei]|uniref:uncharacterized protein FLJ43738 isoform X2 n=1 Tax=Pseudoliparis swirei TaxID=2059687 RepID=UPI0024BEFFE4|nr:uncharacterized protein FLJ43738 isoform X2 [Pseudoliparis swirei]